MVDPNKLANIRKIPYVNVCERSPESLEADADDVIDLGAPRLPRRLLPRVHAAPPPRRDYVPNPRLYPGQPAKASPRSRRAERRLISARPRRHKRVLRRPVPNSRLYRPAPPRPPPPPARPRASWPPPAPVRPLDTASRVALRLGERRQAGHAPPAPAPAARTRRLVVTLPPAAAGDSPAASHYRPASEHFKARAAPGAGSGASTPPAGRAMDAAGRRETSPDCASDGNDSPSSAPSEYLAEFLSAIMRRQYAEALKYCRLILQYEPQNATARGFHPLLQQKLRDHQRAGGGPQRASSGSCSPAESALSEDDSLDLESESASDSASGSAPRWECERSDADTDDNGNLPHLAPATTDEDLENDNAGGDAAVGARAGQSHASTHLKDEVVTDAGAGSTSLQRLRAQFACSIK